MEAPQPLSHKAIAELKEIHEEEFGAAIQDAEAQEMGARLLRLFEILLRSSSGDIGE